MALYHKGLMLLGPCLVSAFFCHAQSSSSCDKALVLSTYNRFSQDKVDWRLASFVTREMYEEIKHNAGAGATIYGVPMTANYDDFKKQIDNQTNSLNESLTHDQAENIMWTGLDPTSATTYSACLQSQVLSSRGLHIVVRSATDQDIAILLTWVPQGADAGTIPITWSGLNVNSSGQALPANATQGQNLILVARPQMQRTLAVNAAGFGDSVTLTPLPAPAPPQPQPMTYSLRADGFPHWRIGTHQVPGADAGNKESSSMRMLRVPMQTQR